MEGHDVTSTRFEVPSNTGFFIEINTEAPQDDIFFIVTQLSNRHAKMLDGYALSYVQVMVA